MYDSAVFLVSSTNMRHRKNGKSEFGDKKTNPKIWISRAFSQLSLQPTIAVDTDQDLSYAAKGRRETVIEFGLSVLLLCLSLLATSLWAQGSNSPPETAT
jgi:hypothetical protein|tara:strand:+ start:137 stop:436 length:300 start_codon:yes stop_codon:yes gene_type:complete